MSVRATLSAFQRPSTTRYAVAIDGETATIIDTHSDTDAELGGPLPVQHACVLVVALENAAAAASHLTATASVPLPADLHRRASELAQNTSALHKALSAHVADTPSPTEGP